jgi:hypothetical protein
MFHVEHAWKVKRNELIRNGNNDVTAWVECSLDIISGLDEENYGVKPTDLTLVCLYKRNRID